MNDIAATAALSVRCPICKAPPSENCHGPKAYHILRAQRGLQRARVDEYKQHERAWKALDRVRLAASSGRTPAASDVTQALGCCGCGECRAAVINVLAQFLKSLA